MVRNIVGYLRFEGEEARKAMAELYSVYGLIVNYFYPSMKIISKERIDAKVIKKYDRARTPYARLMECGDLDDASKEELRRRKDSLDLISLLEKTEELQDRLFSLAVPWRS